jgi:hypothetical protein
VGTLSAELLRRAAAKMRVTAEAATPGPWVARMEGTYPWVALYTDPDLIADEFDLPHVEPTGDHTPGDCPHIASWHPTVALLVADLLDGHAGVLDVVGEFALKPDSLTGRALAVARAYLGEA